MNFPDNLRYSKDHEWIRVEGETGYVGITDFAQGELGDIVYVDVPTIGKTVKQGDIFGTVEAVKTVSDLFMPVSGEVLELNAELHNMPELINTDPYGQGWIIKIRITQQQELASLLDSAAYRQLIGK